MSGVVLGDWIGSYQLECLRETLRKRSCAHILPCRIQRNRQKDTSPHFCHCFCKVMFVAWKRGFSLKICTLFCNVRLKAFFLTFCVFWSRKKRLFGGYGRSEHRQEKYRFPENATVEDDFAVSPPFFLSLKFWGFWGFFGFFLIAALEEDRMLFVIYEDEHFLMCVNFWFQGHETVSLWILPWVMQARACDNPDVFDLLWNSVCLCGLQVSDLTESQFCWATNSSEKCERIREVSRTCSMDKLCDRHNIPWTVNTVNQSAEWYFCVKHWPKVYYKHTSISVLIKKIYIYKIKQVNLSGH